MDILILDNEKREIQKSCSEVEWKKFGVAKTYWANTWAQTFAALELHPITVFLSHVEMFQKANQKNFPKISSCKHYFLPVLIAWERRPKNHSEQCDSTAMFFQGNVIPEFWWKSLEHQKMLLFIRMSDHPQQISLDKLEEILRNIKTIFKFYHVFCYVHEPIKLKQLFNASFALSQEQADDKKKAETLPKLMPKLKAYINENLQNNLTRSDLASQIYVHPDYLSHIFKESVGMSVSQYIMHTRLERSKVLLRSTEKSISQIARQVGYPNTSYFAKLFKRSTGMTPTQFRKDRC